MIPQKGELCSCLEWVNCGETGFSSGMGGYVMECAITIIMSALLLTCQRGLWCHVQCRGGFPSPPKNRVKKWDRCCAKMGRPLGKVTFER